MRNNFKIFSYFIFSTFFVCLTFKSNCQIVSLKTTKLGEASKEIIELCNGCISDINETLVIKLNKNEINKALFNFSNISEIDTKEYYELKSILQIQSKVIEKSRVAGEDLTNEAINNEISEDLIRFYNELIKDSSVLGKLYGQYRTEYDKVYPPSSGAIQNVANGNIIILCQ